MEREKMIINDKEIECYIDYDNKEIWFDQKGMTILYETSQSNIAKRINNLSKNEEAYIPNWNTSSTKNGGICSKMERMVLKNITTQKGNRIYKINLYNHNDVIKIGYALSYEKGEMLKQFVDTFFNNKPYDYNNELSPYLANSYDIVKYENGGISLDVNVSIDGETVWLNQKQIAVLFNTTIKNIAMHISNIYSDKELEEKRTGKDFLLVQIEGSRRIKRKIKHYNLDMIISIGYRVNSKRGIEFRRWASSILKQYLLKGYSINEKRCNECQNQIISLRNEVELMNERINLLNEVAFINDEILFKKGDIIEAFILIRKILFIAKREIIIIDPYADSFIYHLLNDIKTKVIIYTSNKNKIESSDENITIIYKDDLHDRFIIADDLIFSIGTSLNSIGKSEFIIKSLKNISIKDIINN